MDTRTDRIRLFNQLADPAMTGNVFARVVDDVARDEG